MYTLEIYTLYSVTSVSFTTSLYMIYVQGMVITLPTGGSSSQELRKSLATLSDDSGALCVTSFSSAGGGKCVFQCDHSNPHHFHVYNFKNF